MQLQFTPKQTGRGEGTTSLGQASAPHVRMKPSRDKALEDGPQRAPRSEEEKNAFCSCWLSRTIMGPGIRVKLFLPAADPKRETSCLLRGAAPAPPLGWECFQSTFPDTTSADLLRVTVRRGQGPARAAQALGGRRGPAPGVPAGASAPPHAAASVCTPLLCSQTHECGRRPGAVGTTSPICC